MSKSTNKRRRQSYPTIGEQLGSIWKALHQLHLDGVKLPDDTVDTLNKVLAVKRDYPKQDKE